MKLDAWWRDVVENFSIGVSVTPVSDGEAAALRWIKPALQFIHPSKNK
jgi:hypothetical protein